MLPVIRGQFRLMDDPELRFTPSGKAVANVRLVADKKKKDQQTNEWVDDKVLFINGSAWDRMAENIAESLQKGDLVMVEGAIETRSFEDREGNKRSVTDLNIYDIGPSLKWNSARIERTQRQQGQSGGSSAPQQEGGGGGQQAGSSAPAADPWQTPQTDEPPF